MFSPCNHSNSDLFMCEDNMLFSCVKISCFRMKAHTWHFLGVYIIIRSHTFNSMICLDVYVGSKSRLAEYYQVEEASPMVHIV